MSQDTCEHEFVAVHHTDADGNHWCPTGFIMCDHCALMAKIDMDEAAKICTAAGHPPQVGIQNG